MPYRTEEYTVNTRVRGPSTVTSVAYVLHTVGCPFVCMEPCTILGVRWVVPSADPNPGPHTCKLRLWHPDGTSLRSKTVVVPGVGAVYETLFDAPYSVTDADIAQQISGTTSQFIVSLYNGLTYLWRENTGYIFEAGNQVSGYATLRTLFPRRGIPGDARPTNLEVGYYVLDPIVTPTFRSILTVGDQPTRESYKPYQPVVDLNMVRSCLTHRARYYLARAIHDGTAIQPSRFELGTGWENPRWGEPPPPSPDSTGVTNLVYEGSLTDGKMVMEEANASSLAIKCIGPVAPDYEPSELLIYAKILRSANPSEVGLEFPFACVTFPNWFHVPGQRFLTRVLIPLGMGARVESESPFFRLRARAESATAVDAVTVVLNP